MTTGEGSRTHRVSLLTARELAAVLRVTPRWVYNEVETHGLPAYRLGPRALRFESSAVVAWLETRRVGQWETPKSCVAPISRAPL